MIIAEDLPRNAPGPQTSREQAIAIGLSEARKKGAKIPPAPKRSRARKSRKRR